jgi:hypothetical protein
MHFTAPAEPSLSIEVYARPRHSDLTDFFSISTDNVSRYALVLTNVSSMDIVGLAIRWTVTGGDGQQRATKLSCDSFGDSLAARQPVIPAGARLIATASGFKHVKAQPATGFISGSNSRMFGWGRVQFVSPGDLDVAQSVTAVVDVIIFADGRIIGPDESNLAGHINALSAAFKSVAQRLRDATAAADNLESVLRDFASARSRLRRFDDDPAAFWAVMEAERMLRFPTPSIAGRLQQLEDFPSPPNFYR